MRARTLEKLKPAQALKQQGLTYRQIADRIGLSAVTVIGYFQNGNPKPGPGICEVCGRETDRLYRHHPCYSDLKSVARLCASCHTKIHNRERVMKMWQKVSSGLEEIKSLSPPRCCPCCWGTGVKLDQEQLGAIARTFRLSRNETLTNCAKRLGISPSQLSLLEAGKRGWSEALYRKATA